MCVSSFGKSVLLRSRNSRLQMFFKIGVLKNFGNFGNPVLEPLFIKVTGLKTCNFMKKETPTHEFLVNLQNF